MGAPWVKLFPDRLWGGSAPVELGPAMSWYVALLTRQAAIGWIPDDPEKCALSLSLHGPLREAFMEAWPSLKARFTIDLEPGKIANEQMLNHVRESMDRHRSAAERGRLGGYAKASSARAEPVAKPQPSSSPALANENESENGTTKRESVGREVSVPRETEDQRRKTPRQGRPGIRLSKDEKAFMRWFGQQYEAVLGSPFVPTEKDKAAARSLLRAYASEDRRHQLVAKVGRLLKITPDQDAWIPTTDRSLHILSVVHNRGPVCGQLTRLDPSMMGRPETTDHSAPI